MTKMVHAVTEEEFAGMLESCAEMCMRFASMEPGTAKATLAMCMDTVAKMNGQTTVEMLDEIRPIAQAVQDEFGDEGIL